jgi:hypothetical protein
LSQPHRVSLLEAADCVIKVPIIDNIEEPYSPEMVLEEPKAQISNSVSDLQMCVWCLHFTLQMLPIVYSGGVETGLRA